MVTGPVAVRSDLKALNSAAVTWGRRRLRARSPLINARILELSDDLKALLSEAPESDHGNRGTHVPAIATEVHGYMPPATVRRRRLNGDAFTKPP